MAWSWSHTQEAYNAVENQINRKAEKAQDGERDEQEWLVVVSSEIDMNGDSSAYPVWNKKYKKALVHNTRLAIKEGWQTLATKIWDFAQEHATCDNGGFNAWVCPDGCHTLPFTDPEESEE